MGVPPVIVTEELYGHTVVQVIGEDEQYVKALERWHCHARILVGWEPPEW